MQSRTRGIKTRTPARRGAGTSKSRRQRSLRKAADAHKVRKGCAAMCIPCIERDWGLSKLASTKNGCPTPAARNTRRNAKLPAYVPACSRGKYPHCISDHRRKEVMPPAPPYAEGSRPCITLSQFPQRGPRSNGAQAEGIPATHTSVGTCSWTPLPRGQLATPACLLVLNVGASRILEVDEAVVRRVRWHAAFELHLQVPSS